MKKEVAMEEIIRMMMLRARSGGSTVLGGRVGVDADDGHQLDVVQDAVLGDVADDDPGLSGGT